MPPAATYSSLTSHGNGLSPGPGSLNVIFGGNRAWRSLMDSHQCPLSDGSKPHVGGLVLNGSPTVYINGAQAVRMGDMVTEAGSPNKIVSGVTNVIIGP
jgi:uncharacterized Zn-binding protein involved in type VI secretion